MWEYSDVTLLSAELWREGNGYASSIGVYSQILLAPVNNTKTGFNRAKYLQSFWLLRFPGVEKLSDQMQVNTQCYRRCYLGTGSYVKSNI